MGQVGKVDLQLEFLLVTAFGVLQGVLLGLPDQSPGQHQADDQGQCQQGAALPSGQALPVLVQRVQ
ncbi:hypothetical protein D3C80_2160120 [compost metagenome]